MEPTPEEKVGPWQRLLARIVDGLVLFIPTLLVTVPIAGGFQIGTGNVGGKQMAAAAVAVGFAFLYNVVLESSQGASLGKRATGLAVRSADGAKPSLGQAARRNSFILLSAVPGGIGGLLSLVAAIVIAVTIARDPNGRGVHDRFAGLQVVDRD